MRLSAGTSQRSGTPLHLIPGKLCGWLLCHTLLQTFPMDVFGTRHPMGMHTLCSTHLTTDLQTHSSSSLVPSARKNIPLVWEICGIAKIGVPVAATGATTAWRPCQSSRSSVLRANMPVRIVVIQNEVETK